MNSSMYFTFSMIKFKNNFRNKFNILVKILETLLFFIVYMYVFKSLYKGRDNVDGYTLEMVITSILFISCMVNSYINHELFIQEKLKEGAFLTELMKPVDFKAKVLFENIGNVVFNVCFQAVPVILIALMITDIMKPASGLFLMLSLVSSVFGYLIYWYLNLVINEITFFDFSVWALVVIKNGIIDIFGGMLLPMWFMPDVVKQVLYFTPIPYLFQIPVNIYLGLYNYKELICFILVQMIWVVFLFGLSRFIWNKGLEKIFARGV